jgi:hypothetical protein
MRDGKAPFVTGDYNVAPTNLDCTRNVTAHPAFPSTSPTERAAQVSKPPKPRAAPGGLADRAQPAVSPPISRACPASENAHGASATHDETSVKKAFSLIGRLPHPDSDELFIEDEPEIIAQRYYKKSKQKIVFNRTNCLRSAYALAA